MRRAARIGVAVAIAAIALVTIVAVVPPLLKPSGSNGSAIPPPPPTTTGTLAVSAVGGSISAAFYGVGIESGTPLSTDTPSLLSATPIHFLRFPDGTAGDNTDLVNDTVYTPGESNTTSAAVSLAEFIATCRAVSCSAILELPLEIDQPTTAAFEVNYIEHTLGFRPTYWELGNEPGGWTCFGVPWADWASGCHVGINATEYAREVATYIGAVRQVDSTAQFVGLGGTDGPAWITPLEQEDGPNLSAISLHSYVDDLLPAPSNLSLTNFFRGLSAPNSLPSLLATSRKAISEGCPSCSTQIFLTEMDSVSMGQPLAKYLGTFYNAVFFAAEIVQGLNSQASNIDPFTWENNEDGLISANGPAARYVVESTFLSRLGSVDYNASVDTPGMFATMTVGAGQSQLLLVNTNTTYAVNVSLTPSGHTFTGPVDTWTWTPYDPAPVETSPTSMELENVVVPPSSVLLVTGTGSVGESVPR